jgi:hypothetical protein
LSRLDSFIRRLEAQRACLDHAARLVADLPGPVLELGLGNGRTYDHLRERLADREIFVFERRPDPHPECLPDAAHLIVGDLEDTLPKALALLPGPAALAHSDIGTGDELRNRAVAASLSQLLPALLRSGGIIVSDQPLAAAGLRKASPPAGISHGRYFMYRRE